MLATTLGVEFNPDSSYDERKEIWKISDKIVKTTNTTQSSLGKKGYWTTVLAVAVFVENGDLINTGIHDLNNSKP